MPKSFRKHKKIASNPKCTRHYNSPDTIMTQEKYSDSLKQDGATGDEIDFFFSVYY